MADDYNPEATVAAMKREIEHLDEARAEIERLKAGEAACGVESDAWVARLTRERDEARAEVERLTILLRRLVADGRRDRRPTTPSGECWWCDVDATEPHAKWCPWPEVLDV